MGTVLTPPASAGIITNPIVPDEVSLARGKELYTQNCAVCHGATGRGNGPLAIGMNPPPADFVAHVNLHADETLFDWISKGIPGTSHARLRGHAYGNRPLARHQLHSGAGRARYGCSNTRFAHTCDKIARV